MEDVLLAAVEDGRFDVMLLVYNFMNQAAGEQVISACQQKDIGVTIMKAAPGVLVFQEFDPEHPTKDQQAVLDRLLAKGISLEEAHDRIRAWVGRQKEAAEPSQVFARQHGISSEQQLKDKSIQWVLANPAIHTVVVSMRDFDGVEAALPLSGTQKRRSAWFLRCSGAIQTARESFKMSSSSVC